MANGYMQLSPWDEDIATNGDFYGQANTGKTPAPILRPKLSLPADSDPLTQEMMKRSLAIQPQWMTESPAALASRRQAPTITPPRGIGVSGQRSTQVPVPSALRAQQAPQAQREQVVLPPASPLPGRTTGHPDGKTGLRWTPDPSEPLDLIAKHRGTDLLPDIMGGTFRSRFPAPGHLTHWKDWREGSVGLAEMQFRTAAQLMGKDLSDPKQADEVVAGFATTRVQSI